MNIGYATEEHYKFICESDKHISEELIENKIRNKEVILISDNDDRNIGWLRFSYFWDNTPFMNMLFVNEEYRDKGFGKLLVNFWEMEMRSKGYKLVMTSTLSNEEAQHFYRKLNYKDSGSLLLEGEALEIIFTKNL